MAFGRTVVLAVALLSGCVLNIAHGQGCQEDVMMVLDASATVGSLNFDTLKLSVETFINNTYENYPNVNIGYVVVSTTVTGSLGLQSQANQNNLLANLRAATYTAGGSRNIHTGIDQARNFLSSTARPRSIVLVSAGSAANGQLAISAATNAKAVGIRIFGVGVEENLLVNAAGLAAFRQELQQIASIPTFYRDFGLLSSSFGALPNTVCRVNIVQILAPVTLFTSQTFILSAVLSQSEITTGEWLRNNVRITSDPRITISRDGTIQRLTVVNAQLSDSAEYTYRIGTEETRATVTVNPGILLYPRQVLQSINQVITLTVTLVNPQCSAIGTWQFGSTTLQNNFKYSYTVSTTDCRLHTLTVSGAQLSDTGTYTFTLNGQSVETAVTVTTSSVPINGGFSAWTAWSQSQCSATCGTSAIRTLFRSRECNNPIPSFGGNNCTAAFTESTNVFCGFSQCPVPGGLSEWSSWNSASVSCPQTCGTNAVKTVERTRTCTNPRPQFGGAFCSDILFERKSESCGLTFNCPTPVDGDVSDWALWIDNGCPVTCGITATKFLSRTRTCTNPAPSSGGQNCQQSLTETAVINCGLNGCPVNGGLGEWEAWNSVSALCPATCGVSVTKIVSRIRRCNAPEPQFGGQDCTGVRVETRTETCSVPACSFAVNGAVGQWGAWSDTSACSATCGLFAFKSVQRTRACDNPAPSNGGRPCLETLIENTQQLCGTGLACPVNGGVSEWESWNTATAPCDVTCGISATKQIERFRRCNSPAPSNGGLTCTQQGLPLFEIGAASCNTPACPSPINGGVGQWTAWTDPPCAVTCGDAFKNITRTRLCNNPPPSNGGITCTDPLFERSLVSCSLFNCPVNGGVGEWGAWGTPACSLTCGTGVTGRAQRRRFCNNPAPSNGGLFCTQTLFEETFLFCGLPACPSPVDGGVSLWTEWTNVPCGVTCGTLAEKVINRTRTCTPPSNGGRSCQEIGFVLFQSITVNCQLIGCPVNGGVSQWAQWSIPACTFTCGVNQVTTIRRTRTCTNPPPQNGGLTCSQPLEESEFRSCGLPECPGPVNGGFTQWAQWSTPFCTATCGASLQTVVFRTRACTNPVPRNGGADCTGDRFQNQQASCGLPGCPIDGGLTQWAQWGVPVCPVTCGVGITVTASRSRSCTNPAPSNGGRSCAVQGLGSTFETEIRACNIPTCAVNGGYSQWTQWNVPNCFQTCGSGFTTTATRQRFCNTPAPQNGGLDCTRFGSAFDTQVRSCNLPTCAINGGLSEWTQWSVAQCPVTCGVSVTTLATRFRSCTNPPPSDGGLDCSGLGATTNTETRTCPTPQCPINGGLSQWGQWSVTPCTATCGISLNTAAVRFRSCTNPPPQFGGLDCTFLGSTREDQTRSCNLGNCPIDGGLGQWSQWNVPACIRTCGSTLTTTVTRVRFCNSPTPQFGGRNCSGLGSLNDNQIRSCGLPICPINGGLSEWTQWDVAACTISCGVSVATTATRSRSCTNPPPTDGGLDCTGLGATTQTEMRTCPVPQCPINGGLSQWGQWSVTPCTATCGISAATTAVRFRSCTNPPPQFGGTDCTFLGSTRDDQTRSCNLGNCPIDGGLGQWSQWNVPACIRTCGSTLTTTATRVRFCNSPTPQSGGRNCSGLGSLNENQIRSCGLPTCPINGGLSEWTQWDVAACTISCGVSVATTATRFRSCTNPPPTDGGLDCSGLGAITQTEMRTCPVPQCPINGGLSNWGQWSVTPCTATCGISAATTAVRFRSCTNPPPQFGGTDCTFLGSTRDDQTRSCNLGNCPIDGGLGQWSQWNVPACIRTCGSTLTTTATRVRFCNSPTPQSGGRNCSGLGSLNENQIRSCGLPTCPINGGLSEWTQWDVAACTISCGVSVATTATRFRSCTNPPPTDGGLDCRGLGAITQTEMRTCPVPQCPINGGLSNWGQWSVTPCTSTCGSSQATTAVRFRSCTNPPPQFGGTDCTFLGSTRDDQTRSCNLGNCPIDGGFTEWTAWNFPACTVTCGLSQFRTVTRRRFCSSPTPQFGGRTCQGNDVDSYTENCNLPSCARDGGISQWTAWVEPQCVITCGPTATFIAYRQRFCNNPPPRDGGRNCTESRWDTDVRNCGLPACPVDGGVSQWTQWNIPACPATCGRFQTRTVTRSRVCTNPPPSSGGNGCTASLFDSEVRSCDLNACPIDGNVGQWSQWAIPPCSQTCGTSLTRQVSRVRFCDSPYPQNGGRNCSQNLDERITRLCGLPRCTVDGGFSVWSQWSALACTTTCGINAQTFATRTRTCTNPVPQDGGLNCTGNFAETTTRGCNLNPCPINGGLTQWTQWIVPNCGVTCGRNRFVTAHRIRSCTNPIPRYGGFNCTSILDETEQRSCNLSPCPVDGGLTQWTGWTGTPCQRTCGTTETRIVTRTRQCNNPPASNNGQSCTGNLFESETRTCSLTPCPTDGGISQWTQWSDPPCSITCGPSANKVVSRTRVCDNPVPQFGGRVCTDSRFEYEVRSCNLGNCPVNGGVTLWTEWSGPECAVTCGLNPFRTVRRGRSCTNPQPQFGGLDCPQNLIETASRVCDVPACPVDGGLTQWSLWNDPPCAVTCGTAATKTVVRTRSCSNPVPQNNGKECVGDLREEDIRSCNLQRCPVRLAGLCQSAQIVNGVGYRYHPTDCDKYIQCYYNPNGYVIGAYRSCPFGYYWDQRTLRCDHPWKVQCPLEKCGNCTSNYNLEGSCRSHWVCEKGVSRAECCPMGFRYVVGQGCKPDFYCRDTCPTPCASRDVCDKRPDWNNDVATYNISVGLLGWMASRCVSGNYFDLLDCGCGIPSNASCTPDYSMMDFNTMTTTQPWLSMTDISLLNGYAVFNGIGHMFVNISQKAPASDCPLIVRFTFTESPSSTGRRILASTSDCYKANTLVIAMEEDAVVFEMKSVFGQMFRMPLSLGGFSSYEWKTVTMVYDGKMMTAVIESNNLKYMQWQFAPEISLMECGLRLGSDGSMSSAERFTGNLQSFHLYRCNPGGLY